MDWQRVEVKKARLTGVGLFRDLNTNADQFRLVREHRNETGMWDLDKVLIGALAHLTFLFPGVVLPDAQHAYPLSHQQVNNPVTYSVHIVIDTPVPLVRHAFH